MEGKLEFKKLNVGWNADPNAPNPTVDQNGNNLLLHFDLNHFIYPRFKPGDCGVLTFTNCSQFLLGGTNDEGWYMGHCRYGKQAPAWGEFYEVTGADPIRNEPEEWCMTGVISQKEKHFLFYLRDETFECIADDWALSVIFL